MLVHDRLQAVAAQHPDGGVGCGLRAGGTRLLVEDRHLPHHRPAPMPRQGDLVPVVVEVDADLAVDHDVKLGADIASAKHRLALGVMPGHHEPVDAGELLEGERAEQRHPFQRDQLFHVFTESLRRGGRRFADPLVGMIREGFDLRLRQRPRHHRVERLRFEQASQRPGEPARAEV